MTLYGEPNLGALGREKWEKRASPQGGWKTPEDSRQHRASKSGACGTDTTADNCFLSLATRCTASHLHCIGPEWLNPSAACERNVHLAGTVPTTVCGSNGPGRLSTAKQLGSVLGCTQMDPRENCCGDKEVAILPSLQQQSGPTPCRYFPAVFDQTTLSLHPEAAQIFFSVACLGSLKGK